MAWSRDGILWILVNATSDPTDAEWRELVDEMARVSDSSTPPKVLIRSHGGGPGALQRGYLEETLGGHGLQPRCALVTKSKIVRGIGVAVSWFTPAFKVFPPPQMDRAYAHLELTPSEIDYAKRELRLLERALHVDQRSTG